MAQVRPPSPTLDQAHPKRLKTSHAQDSTDDASAVDVAACFAPDLFDPPKVDHLRFSYAGSTPFKHVVLDALFRDDLLRGVKDECLGHLSFTEKETDIYKLNQTGDLASLSYLSDDQRALFPNLLVLRDALYSPRFRAFLRAVTGCGPLSGTTQDMSVNSYTRGCHLLNHDDVIGTRRVSYVLYMPLPVDKPWRAEFGGALELYPVREEGAAVPEPQVAPVKSIPPGWNQFIFFEVQPGRSFHSVEEVIVNESGYARLSISGWFHAAQPGEDGYVPEQAADPQESASSRAQLTSSSNAVTFTQYDDTADDTDPPHPDIPLSPAHMSYLEQYLNPAYLQLRTLKTIMAQFVTESNVQLQRFLVDDLATALEEGLAEADRADGLDGISRAGELPSHGLGVPPSSTALTWTVKGPPHKWRYCTLSQEDQPDPDASLSSSATVARAKAERILRDLRDTFFPSVAFRAWLTIVTKLIPLSCAIEARRFRPGLDYTLATSDEGESRLDVVLGLTPQVQQPKQTENENGARHSKAKEKAKASEVKQEDEERPTGWQAGEWGGWECYMSPHNEEDDPAVYRSGSSKKSQEKERPKSSGASASNSVDDEEDEGDDEEGTLLTWQPHFNCLLLVLRDEGVLRFVKYVSAAAPGSRWDICGEFEVGMVEDDNDDENEDGDGDEEDEDEEEEEEDEEEDTEED